MLLQKAMRYYRLWIYTCNVVLFLGVLIFVVTAAFLLCDARFKFVPVRMYHPTFMYAYLALVVQGGLLQVVGCYGALRLNEKWLNVYWLAMLLLLVGDLLVGVVWIFLFNGLALNLPTVLWARFQVNYGYDPQYTAAWNQLQHQSHCCGVYGPRDYNGSRWAQAFLQSSNGSSVMVPASCCLPADLAIPEELVLDNEETVMPGGDSSISNGSYLGAPYSPLLVAPPSPPVSCQSSDRSRVIARSRGCAAAIQDWMQHCADVLFVIGYCVIAFLKLCFLGILRYEIKEMIQKIKMLHNDAPAFPELAGLGLTVLGGPQQNSLTDKCGNYLNCVTPNNHFSVVHSVIKTGPNGNNNDLELTEMPRNIS